MDINALDRTILAMMQENAKSRLEDIAEAAGASIATIQRRIRHLKEAGVIVNEVATIDPAAIGIGMSFLILVELEREKLEKLDEFRARVLAEPLVQQCYYITGEADFALIALAKDMKEYQHLTQRLFFDDSNVKRFRTSVVMDQTKTGMKVPI